MKTTENNKLIAEFMGVKPRMESPDVYTYNDGVFFMCREDNPEKVMDAIAGYVKYHTSWDWLMPVINKVKSIDDEFKIEEVGVYDIVEENETPEIIYYEYSIEETYKSIVEFIKSYNKN